jgi:hypothetical protein
MILLLLGLTRPMNTYRIDKEMLLLAALRAALFVLTFISRELPLNDNERLAVVERLQAALLGPVEA